MTNSWPYPDFDAPDVEPDDSGYAYDDEISTSRLAHLHDTGKMCGEYLGKPGPKPLPLEVRFWRHVKRGDGCWEWTGHKIPRRARGGWGYGLFRVDTNGQEWLAHRVAYALAHGSVPDDRVVRHACDNPGCVNPAHLILGTQNDNVRDRDERGRHVSWCAQKTHCKNGHEFTPENTYHRPDAPHQRQCKRCGYERNARRRGRTPR